VSTAVHISADTKDSKDGSLTMCSMCKRQSGCQCNQADVRQTLQQGSWHSEVERNSTTSCPTNVPFLSQDEERRQRIAKLQAMLEKQKEELESGEFVYEDKRQQWREEWKRRDIDAKERAQRDHSEAVRGFRTPLRNGGSPSSCDSPEPKATTSLRSPDKSEEECWQALEQAPAETVRFHDIPWPGRRAEVTDKFTARALARYGSFPTVMAKQATATPPGGFKAVALRWHPDKFLQKMGHRLHPDDKEHILGTVTEVFQRAQAKRAKR